MERVWILVNPDVTSASKREAADLADRLPSNRICELTFPVREVPDYVRTTIVYGGDGSIKGVSEALLEQKDPGLLVTTKSGSQHGLDNSLRDAKANLTIEQLLAGDTEHIPDLRPGSMNGEIFVHLAGLTQTENLQLYYANRLRPYTPRMCRGFIGVVPAFFALRPNQHYPQYRMRMLMPGPFIGRVKTYPEQKLHSDKVTLVSFEASSKVEGFKKVAAASFYLMIGRKPPINLVEITTQELIEVDVQILRFNIDGESRIVPHNGRVLISRDQRSLKVAALSSSLKEGKM